MDQVKPKRIRRSFSSLSESLVRIGSIGVKSKFSSGFGSRIISPPPSPSSPTASSPLSSRSSPASSPVSPSSDSFTTFRVRMYASEGRGNYGYTQVQVPQSVPKIQVSPPDNHPFRMEPEPSMRRCSEGSAPPSHRRVQPVPPSQHARHFSGPVLKTLWTVPLGAIAEIEAPAQSLPDSPPLSPVHETPLMCKFDSYPPPPSRRPPPPPPQPRRRPPPPPPPLVSKYDCFPPPPSRRPPSPPTSPVSSRGGMGSWLPPNENSVPFISFSPPSSPFVCTFPEFAEHLDLPYEEELESEVELEPEVEELEPEVELVEPEVSGYTAPSLLSLPAEILLEIFSHLSTPGEIGALALTNFHLFNLFQPNAMSILTAVLKYNSPALHSLLVASGVDPSFGEQTAAIERFRETELAIKQSIRERCHNFLSKHLLRPETEAQEQAFDEAIFNVWAFSELFSARPAEVEEQVEWLRCRSLDMQELKDMLEVYQCVGNLLNPLTSDLSLAVQAGVVEELGDARRIEMENELEMWVLWMQTMELGTLQAVLEVGEEDEAGRWDAVVEQGLADRWEGSGGKDGEGALRRFLRGAVGVVYAEHSEAARKRAVEASWEGWGPTWEV